MTSQRKSFGDLRVGDRADTTRTVSIEDFASIAKALGQPATPGLSSSLLAALATGLTEENLIGPDARVSSQSLEFLGVAKVGDELALKAEVTGTEADALIVTTEVQRTSDTAVLLRATVRYTATTEAAGAVTNVPDVVVLTHRHFEALLDRVHPLPPLPTAVVAPEDPNSLGGALLAREQSIIEPILVGAKDRILDVAQGLGRNVADLEIVDVADHAAAANAAVDLVADGNAGAVMKGHLHTDDLLRATLRKDRGLRAGRRYTHTFVMDVPGFDRLLLISDAAINIAPDLATKRDIVQNAIDLASSIGIEDPKAAVLSAVEVVNPQIASSVEAAQLAKMADRGQINGGLVDGPLAMDNAVDLAAAETKGIHSKVAGRSDILIVPNIDAGNMLFKQLTFVANAKAAGVVLGAKVPIILTSRSDDDVSRLASCAVAVLHHTHTAKSG